MDITEQTLKEIRKAFFYVFKRWNIIQQLLDMEYIQTVKYIASGSTQNKLQ